MSRRPVLLLLLTGCAARWEIEPDNPCDNVGYAIASRVHACSGDEGAANEAYERFERDTVCLAQGNPKRTDYACAVSITTRDCDAVDPAMQTADWLDEPACSELLVIGETVDTGVSR